MCFETGNRKVQSMPYWICLLINRNDKYRSMGSLIFPKEYKLNSIGGRLKNDYYTFRQSVLVINANYLPLFLMLGFSKPEDKDFIIDTLIASKEFMYDVRDRYIDYLVNQVKEGKVKPESILKKITIRKIEAMPDDEKNNTIRREIQRSIKCSYRDTFSRFLEKYNPSPSGYNALALKVCRDALSLSSNGFVIDVEEYIRIYEEFIRLDESIIRRQQQAAADAINEFFNGKAKVTREDFDKYFIIENGVVKPNPDSINTKDYMRLGYRGKAKK